MEFNGTEVEVKITGKTLILYKQAFKEDMLGSLLIDGHIDYVSVMKYLYIFEKQMGHDVPSKFNDYADGLAIGDVMDIAPEIIKAVNESAKSSKKKKTVK